MSENRTGKYFKYAIGEILLVVVGILIALAINNWNEKRKLKKTEIELLKELKADLNATLNDLESDIEMVKWTLEYTDSIFKGMVIHKNKKSTEPISIRTSKLLNPILYPKLGAYEALQNYGINNISNEELRGDITDFYQLQLTRVAEVERRIIDYDADELKPYIRDTSIIISDCEDCNSINNLWDVQLLIQRPTDKLLHLYMSRYWLFLWANSLYERIALKIEKLIKTIDSELEMK